MKKSEVKKFAARVKDCMEEELVNCGFDRTFSKNYLKKILIIEVINNLISDLIELKNYKKFLGDSIK